MKPRYYEFLRFLKNRKGKIPCSLDGEWLGDYDYSHITSDWMVEALRQLPLYFSTYEILGQIGPRGEGFSLLEMLEMHKERDRVFEVDFPSKKGGRVRYIILATTRPNRPEEKGWAAMFTTFVNYSTNPNRWFTEPFQVTAEPPREGVPNINAFCIIDEDYQHHVECVQKLLGGRFEDLAMITGMFLWAIKREPRIVVRDTLTMPNSGPKAVRKAHPTVDREYHLVVLRSEVKKYINRDWQGGTHASPVEHERAGHIRVLGRGTENERRVHVSGCIVNPGHQKPIAYRVDP